MTSCVVADISIAAVDLLQEMTDVETDDDNEDSINAFFDALVSIICLHCWYLVSYVMGFFHNAENSLTQQDRILWDVSCCDCCLLMLIQISLSLPKA